MAGGRRRRAAPLSGPALGRPPPRPTPPSETPTAATGRRAFPSTAGRAVSWGTAGPLTAGHRSGSPDPEAPIPFSAASALLGYAFLSTVALAVVPHEPVVIWYGAHYGIWSTALLATAGTVVAAWVDHRAFVPLIRRVAHTPFFAEGSVGWLRGRFARAPFAVLAASGLAPVPAFPFKAMAFAEHYPRGRYVAAVAVGRFPRYLLLAWLGVVITIPTWVLVALFAAMLLPSVRLAWRRRSER